MPDETPTPLPLVDNDTLPPGELILKPTTKVFIANYSAHDYASAEKFGEIHYITKGYVSFYSLDRVRVGITQSILRTTPEDYLLLSGTSLICVLAAVAWVHVHKQVKLLTWDNKKREYRPMIVTAANMAKLIEALTDGAISP